jgi:hypothetical protein
MLKRIRRIVESMLSSARRKVHVIVNYDNFSIYPDILDEYSAMVRILRTGSIPAPLGIRPAVSCGPNLATP